MLSVSNVNLIALIWQNKRVISKLKFTAILAKPDHAVYFTLSGGVFRTLSNVQARSLSPWK